MARASEDKAITESLAYFIAKDMMPFRIVERPGFNALMKTVAPKYKIPRRQHFSEKEIPNMYLKLKSDINQTLKPNTLHLQLISGPVILDTPI